MIEAVFLKSAIQQFKDYKSLADKTFSQLSGADFFYRPNPQSNSLAILITHMHGNMSSRWTNFLTEDGEKEWRTRDAEFETKDLTPAELLVLWEQGWRILFEGLEALIAGDLERTVYVRAQPSTVTEAVHRQLAHHASHVGQILYIGKMINGPQWQTLSIAKGGSAAYNAQLIR